MITEGLRHRGIAIGSLYTMSLASSAPSSHTVSGRKEILGKKVVDE